MAKVSKQRRVDTLTKTAAIEQRTTVAKTNLTPEQQSAILYWAKTAKIPIISCDSKTKGVHYKDWPHIDFSQVDFNARLAAGEYDNGIAIVLGKTLSGQYYSFALDFDG
jgi:hypothetical protein